MNLIGMFRSRFVYCLILVLIATVSSFSLWIIESWIKYPLIVFEVATILYVSAVIIGWDFRFSNSLNRSHISFFPIVPELILLAFSCLLLFLNSYGQSEYSTIFQLLMIIPSSSVLVGLCIFNIFNLNHAFTNLERLIISFVISVVFSAVVSFTILPLDLNSKPISISVIFGATAIISLIFKTTKRKSVQKNSHNKRSFSRNVDIIGIILCEVFYIFIFLIIYPDTAHIVGTDINRHYGNTLVLLTTPSLYNGFHYIFFNLFQGVVLSFSGMNQDIGLLQTSLVFLNCLLPLSVYALARRYLSKFDVRLPILATVFYLMLSNLSFLYYIEQKIGGIHATEVALIQGAR